jgi:2-polyprenyl-6-methoxyphenol hydroxylase-like FAD-dependent oxidoreductase
MSESVIIVGAGISGLCSGLVLAKNGHKVTLIERDPPPPLGDADEAFFNWNRRGAAQFRHPHAFLAAMSNLLQDSFPELIEDFWQAGARKIAFKDMVPPELESAYIPEPEDERMWLLMCRRATMETVFRRYAERSNLTILSNTQVLGPCVDSSNDLLKVNGIKIKTDDGEQQELLADIVIDAGGRNSKFKEWLSAHGAHFSSEDDDAEIVYYTRHYKLLNGVQEPTRNSDMPSAGDLGYMKFGVFPGEGGHFAVIICLPNHEEELREAIKDGDKYDQICQGIPGLARWIGPDKCEATTSSFGFGDIHAIWHHSVHDGRPAALNFFSVGDAALRTNPLYGRGCSTGVIHAHLLAKLIKDVSDPLERALKFNDLTEEELRPIFKASLNEDRRGIKRAKAILADEELDKVTGLKQWLGASFGDAIGRASREQVHVLRGAMRTFNLLEKPGDFLKGWRIRLTILRYMLKGRKHNAAIRLQRGPKRGEMLDIVRNEQPENKAA